MRGELLEQVGPNGNVQAVVEADEYSAYFYLFGSKDSGLGMRSVWVRNHGAAPESLDVDRMKFGLPPRNVRGHCRHPQGLGPLNREALRVVWLPEGNGAALYEGDELLAILPPWSGLKGFHGYARDAIGDGPVAWEIGKTNVLVDRFREAEAYWGQWNGEAWPSMRDALLAAIERTLGRHDKYYAIDGGNWPPRALVRIPRDDAYVFLTIGMSARPQPNVEMATEEPELLRRVEMGAILPASLPTEALNRFGSYLSGQSAYPWERYTWFGAVHTVPCNAWPNPKFPFALVQHEHSAAPTPSRPNSATPSASSGSCRSPLQNATQPSNKEASSWRQRCRRRVGRSVSTLRDQERVAGCCDGVNVSSTTCDRHLLAQHANA
ncbi:MAG: hypothetical protein U0744_08180 [Gemmataceae bacterium]